MAVAETTLTTALSGRVAAPVRVRFYRFGPYNVGYSFATSWNDRGEWDLRLGPLVSPNGTGIETRLVDLNFDGYADLWARAYQNQRVEGSDVWLYEPEDSARAVADPYSLREHFHRAGYVYSVELSALPNLGVDTTAQRLVAGIGNCGCGGACFHSEVYRREGGAMVLEQRRTQECLGEEFEYRVWERRGDRLVETVNRRDPFHSRDTYDLDAQYAPNLSTLR